MSTLGGGPSSWELLGLFSGFFPTFNGNVLSDVWNSIVKISVKYENFNFNVFCLITCNFCESNLAIFGCWLFKVG